MTADSDLGNYFSWLPPWLFSLSTLVRIVGLMIFSQKSGEKSKNTYFLNIFSRSDNSFIIFQRASYSEMSSFTTESNAFSYVYSLNFVFAFLL